MIFGLAEADNEDLHFKTLDMFEELNEKPFFKVDRLGRKREDSKSRPVKVTGAPNRHKNVGQFCKINCATSKSAHLV